jgi:hypothetical protein
MARPDAFSRSRIRRGCEHLHRLGPRAETEFLIELSARIGGMPAILRLLAEFEERLTPALLRATGGDRFAPRQLDLVPRR